MPIKTAIRYQITPVRMAIIKRQWITNAGKDVEKRDLSYSVYGNINWFSHYEK